MFILYETFVSLSLYWDILLLIDGIGIFSNRATCKITGDIFLEGKYEKHNILKSLNLLSISRYIRLGQTIEISDCAFFSPVVKYLIFP